MHSQLNQHVTLRKAGPRDLEQVLEVEAGATPKLRYLPRVFEQFLHDPAGEFMVAELEGRLAACAKFSLMPEGSAWLETLRVLPEFQGRGLGKMMYQRFFELARRQNTPVMRMYTGVNNAVSKSLAERFGFSQVAECKGAWLACGHPEDREYPFRALKRHQEASELIMPRAEEWGGFMVMNRTFYAITPELCAFLANEGMVYADRQGNLLVAGARFMPEQSLHLGMFHGEVETCLDFALHIGAQSGAGKVSCLFPAHAQDIEGDLAAYGFQFEPSGFIVMEARI